MSPPGVACCPSPDKSMWKSPHGLWCSPAWPSAWPCSGSTCSAMRSGTVWTRSSKASMPCPFGWKNPLRKEAVSGENILNPVSNPGRRTAMETYRVIDADGHVFEPPDLFERYIEEPFKKIAPRLVTDNQGYERLLVEGLLHPKPEGRAVGITQGFNFGGRQRYTDQMAG